MFEIFFFYVFFNLKLLVPRGEGDYSKSVMFEYLRMGLEILIIGRLGKPGRFDFWL